MFLRATVLLVLVAAVQAGAEKREILATAARPPAESGLPWLEVYRGELDVMVAAHFPNVPDFTCESWCYESAVDFVAAHPLDGHRIEVRHRNRARPHVLIVTIVTPEPGAVEFVARAELDSERADPDAALPDNLLTPNMCWQLRKAPAFASAPDPYPEFVKRCFIFTDAGRTFLHNTTRRLIPCRAPDDAYNNPPWVQMYVGVWRPIPSVTEKSWADYSTDRYTIPVIGAVSRDGKHLTALGNGCAGMLCQAWHDCMHNNAQWLPADAPPAERTWRVKVYVMDNDPEALLKRLVQDFPAAKSLANTRVPAE
jgi:hypothetical protein